MLDEQGSVGIEKLLRMETVAAYAIDRSLTADLARRITAFFEGSVV